jgi:non-heme Fe2+,alpha-ketoglutarate-dependent halogenase
MEQRNAIHANGRGLVIDYREQQNRPAWSPNESKTVSTELKGGAVIIIFWSTLMLASSDHTARTQKRGLGFISRYVPTVMTIDRGRDEIHECGQRSAARFRCTLVPGADRYPQNRLSIHKTTGIPFRRS